MSDSKISSQVLEKIFERFSYIRNELTEDIAKEAISLTESLVLEREAKKKMIMPLPFEVGTKEWRDAIEQARKSEKEKILKIIDEELNKMHIPYCQIDMLLFNGFIKQLKKRIDEI